MKKTMAVCSSLLLLAGAAACSGDVDDSAPQPTADASLPDATAPDTKVEDSVVVDAAPSDAEVSPGSVTLRFRNTFEADIYLDWSWSDKAQPRVGKPGQTDNLQLSSACTTPCSGECVCVMCDAPPPRAKKLAPGAFVEFTWDGQWFEMKKCGDAACNCHEIRYVVPGDFEASLTGGLAKLGGTPDPQDPTLYNNASVDTSAGICTASGSFPIPAEATIELPFACAVP